MVLCTACLFVFSYFMKSRKEAKFPPPGPWSSEATAKDEASDAPSRDVLEFQDIIEYVSSWDFIDVRWWGISETFGLPRARKWLSIIVKSRKDTLCLSKKFFYISLTATHLDRSCPTSKVIRKHRSYLDNLEDMGALFESEGCPHRGALAFSWGSGRLEAGRGGKLTHCHKTAAPSKGPQPTPLGWLCSGVTQGSFPEPCPSSCSFWGRDTPGRLIVYSDADIGSFGSYSTIVFVCLLVFCSFSSTRNPGRNVCSKLNA